MIELECLMELHTSIDEAEKRIVSSGAKYKTTNKIIDTYYYDPKTGRFSLNSQNKLTEALRLRRIVNENKNIITYKKDHYLGASWLYSDEYELSVSSFYDANTLLGKIGYSYLVNLRMEKKIFEYDKYTIVLEKVQHLGNFIEMELSYQIRERQVLLEKQKIIETISQFNLETSSELNSGKPELMLLKKKLNNNGTQF